MSDPETRSAVAPFETAEDEIKFWDTTDLTTLDPEMMTTVDVTPRRRPPATTFAVRLQQSTVEEIRRLAAVGDIGPTQLVRRWITERLAIELAAATAVGQSALPPAIVPAVVSSAVSAVHAEIGPFLAKVIEDVTAKLTQASVEQ